MNNDPEAQSGEENPARQPEAAPGPVVPDPHPAAGSVAAGSVDIPAPAGGPQMANPDTTNPSANPPAQAVQSASIGAVGGGAGIVSEVKYSLEELLVEVEQERAASVLGKQMVDQGEIQKFFKPKRKKKKKRASETE